VSACKVYGCLRPNDGKLMCPAHWALVPSELRGEVWRSLREYKTAHRLATENQLNNASRRVAEDKKTAYMMALNKAVSAVEDARV
jgi:hypothetical protein